MVTSNVGPRPARIWRLVVGVILMLYSVAAIVGSAANKAVEDINSGGQQAGAIGTMIGLGINIAIGIGGFWLLRSGRARR